MQTSRPGALSIVWLWLMADSVERWMDMQEWRIGFRIRKPTGYNEEFIGPRSEQSE